MNFSVQRGQKMMRRLKFSVQTSLFNLTTENINPTEADFSRCVTGWGHPEKMRQRYIYVHKMHFLSQADFLSMNVSVTNQYGESLLALKDNIINAWQHESFHQLRLTQPNNWRTWLNGTKTNHKCAHLMDADHVNLHQDSLKLTTTTEPAPNSIWAERCRALPPAQDPPSNPGSSLQPRVLPPAQDRLWTPGSCSPVHGVPCSRGSSIQPRSSLLMLGRLSFWCLLSRVPRKPKLFRISILHCSAAFLSFTAPKNSSHTTGAKLLCQHSLWFSLFRENKKSPFERDVNCDTMDSRGCQLLVWAACGKAR